MSSNPLFPGGGHQAEEPNSYLLNNKQGKVEPLAGSGTTPNKAADLIREKLARIYSEEPSVKQELTEVGSKAVRPRSKHQEFMYALSTSGKGLAEIQTEWHNYYANLPDNEKHQVWQEFYENNRPGHQPQFVPHTAPEAPSAQPAPLPSLTEPFVSAKSTDKRGANELRRRIRHKVSAGGKLKRKHHLQSLFFGLGVGAVVIIIFLFGFFNEVIIAPFIQPSRTAAATPIIVDPSSVTPSSTPEIIIPKINVQIPIDFSQTSTNEATIETALEDGIVHYPSTVKPGQNGNAAFFGHSSNNIFNKGKYKFAFVLLHELVPGDTFYITHKGKVYIYKVFDKKVVEPHQIEVLDNIPGKTATATLITCDPPGTSLHRLVVVGEQISPDPSGNTAGNNTSQTTVTTDELPGNGPTLLGRFWDWLF